MDLIHSSALLGLLCASAGLLAALRETLGYSTQEKSETKALSWFVVQKVKGASVFQALRTNLCWNIALIESISELEVNPFTWKQQRVCWCQSKLQSSYFIYRIMINLIIYREYNLHLLSDPPSISLSLTSFTDSSHLHLIRLTYFHNHNRFAAFATPLSLYQKSTVLTVLIWRIFKRI